MKKRFGVGIVLLLGIVLALSVLAARLPVNGQDSSSWGTLLNDYLGVVHDSGGSLKGSVVGGSQISDTGIQAIDINVSVINTTHILDATIGAIDIPADVINATHLSAVSTLIFGHCTTTVPAFAVATMSNNTVTNGTTAGNCTINGASTGNAVIITPAYGLNAELDKMSGNLTITGAQIVGSNLSINFTKGGVTGALDESKYIRFNYIVFANGSG